METTPAPFDLNQAVRQWRDDLAQSPAIRRESLDELETHLRDSVTRLQARELSAEEAFLIATKRMGSTTRLGAEFGKMNSQSTWIDRVFWAVVIMQGWFVFQTLGSIFVSFTRIASTYSGTGGMSVAEGWQTASVYVAASSLPLFLAALVLWRLFQSPQSRARTFLESFSRRPFALAMILLGANVLVHLLVPVSYAFAAFKIPVRMYFQPLPGELFYAAIIFVLARKRLLRKA